MQTSDLERVAAEAPETNEPQEPERYELDILDLLIVLARRKRLIFRFTVGAAVLAAVISSLLPNRYTAMTTIMPPQQTQSTASMLMSQLAGSGLGSLAALAGKDLGIKNPNDLFVGILQSRTIEDALIQKFELQRIYRDKRMSDTRKDLENASDIISGKEGLIRITVEDKDPKRAADLANAYVTELRNLMQHLAVTEAAQRRLFFEQQLMKAKNDLADSEVALRDTQQKTGMIQLDSQAKAIIEAVGRLRAQIAAKEVQLEAMRSFSTDQNPDYVLARQELAGLQAQLAKMEQQPGGLGDPLLGTGKLPAAGLEYVRKLREVKYREAIFELLAKQYEAAKLDEAKEAAVIQVVDAAAMPDKKSSPKRIIIVMLATVLGALGSTCYVLGSDTFAKAASDPKFGIKLQFLKGLLRHNPSRKSR